MCPVTRRAFLETAATAAAAAAVAEPGEESCVKPSFAWPAGNKVALSLSFDDARESQVDVAFPLLQSYGVKATFYVVPENLAKRPAEWRAIREAGHEIGNHTVNHPCSGNFEFSRDHALENYTLKEMEKEMRDCNRCVEETCGCVPETFAYPCGNTFVGRGRNVRSYVPLVARHFLAGRSFPSEWHNTPRVCDLAQVNGVSVDNLDFAAVRALIENARENTGWLILAGHDTGVENRLMTRCDTLRALCEYALDPDNGVWLDTVAGVARYILDWRKKNLGKGEP